MSSEVPPVVLPLMQTCSNRTCTDCQEAFFLSLFLSYSLFAVIFLHAPSPVADKTHPHSADVCVRVCECVGRGEAGGGVRAEGRSRAGLERLESSCLSVLTWKGENSCTSSSSITAAERGREGAAAAGARWVLEPARFMSDYTPGQRRVNSSQRRQKKN